LERLLDKYPQSELYVSALIRLGLINYNAGNTDMALRSYKRVFEHNPTAAQGREALTAIEEIYVQDLRQPDAYFAFVNTIPGYEISAMRKDSLSFRTAEIQYEQGDYAGSVKSFSDYLQRYPNGINMVTAYFYRGDAHALLKNYPAALSDFEVVTGRGPGQFYLDALSRSAILAYNHAQDFQKAFHHYSTLYGKVSDPIKKSEAALGAVRSAYRAGLLPKVAEWYPRVTSDVSSSDVIRAEAFYYGAKASLDQKEYQTSIELFRKVAALSDNIQAAESRFRIAQIEFFTGKFAAAEQSCNAANAQNGNYPYWVAKSLILISDIAVQRQDYFNARAPLEAVIENFQGDSQLVEEARQKLATVIRLEQEHSKVHRDTSKTLEMIEDHNK
jgi:tetratricopeptide (TPR) repeat protein